MFTGEQDIFHFGFPSGATHKRNEELLELKKSKDSRFEENKIN